MKKLLLVLAALTVLPAFASELTDEQAAYHFNEYFQSTDLCQAGNPGQNYDYDYFCTGEVLNDIEVQDNQYVIEVREGYGLTTIYTLQDDGNVDVSERDW